MDWLAVGGWVWLCDFSIVSLCGCPAGALPLSDSLSGLPFSPHILHFSISLPNMDHHGR
ncbi:hypothetical protein BO70DRAFT_357770 [Aspergillus heteromorphus CBS 117.55]|uniref:Uncharacterized protein n=1 Tax=Aspergillus heteromorphus CBS 117.55 TaxID=1448321 RepID=A0A317X3A5_9EURO|nr:uncharacterized protein BO70DRAFT_357770 [Aspergillus heteromorphus CBS 117.55]PWY92631.1 hypothetical protein BO70DRAFT_357770 [Aspergillus heteromorphus CBS 117.55]